MPISPEHQAPFYEISLNRAKLFGNNQLAPDDVCATDVYFVELHRHIEVSQSGIVIHLGNTVIALYQFVTQLKAFFVFP